MVEIGRNIIFTRFSTNKNTHLQAIWLILKLRHAFMDETLSYAIVWTQ